MLRGAFPPIPTPFEDGEVSADRLARNLDRWNEQPLDGYVVLGSNGEAPLLDHHERQAVVRTVYERIQPRHKMIVGVGMESTRATIRCVKEAFDLGADAVLAGVPCYYKPLMTDEVLRDHFLRVADASPGPVLLYSVPGFTGLAIGPDLFAALIRHERIAGIKDSSGEIEAIEALVEAAGGAGRDIAVLVGSAGIYADGLARGASGSVLAVGCVASELVAEIARCVAAGRVDEARRLNGSVRPLAEAVTIRHGVGGLKAALDLLHFHGGDPRPPLPTAGPTARAEIAALMGSLGLLT